MTTQLRRMIDGLELDNDIDGLSDLLMDHEDDDEARELLYEVIDRVAVKIDNPVDLDEIWMLS